MEATMDLGRPGTIVWMPKLEIVRRTNDRRRGPTAARRPLVQLLKQPLRDGWARKSPLWEDICANEQNKNICDHPAVVVHRVGDVVWLFILTNLKNNTLAEKCAASKYNKSAILMGHVPFYGSPNHPRETQFPQYQRLKLAPGSPPMSRLGYLSIEVLICMNVHDLRCFQANRIYHLSPASLQAVQDHAFNIHSLVCDEDQYIPSTRPLANSPIFALDEYAILADDDSSAADSDVSVLTPPSTPGSPAARAPLGRRRGVQ